MKRQISQNRPLIDSHSGKSNPSSILPKPMSEEITRRRFLGLASAGAFGFALAPYLAYADNSSTLARILATESLAKPEENALVAVGFLAIGGELQYVDGFHKGCGGYERLTDQSIALDSAVVHTCSHCGEQCRMAPGLLQDPQIQAALKAKKNIAGLLTSETEPEIGEIHKHLVVVEVSPADVEDSQVSITRSALCQAVEEREPVNVYTSDILYVSAPAAYFTEASAPDLKTYIHHVWRINGKVTDTIRLEVSGGRWRTYSMKEKLESGYWTVSAETEDAHVLDIKHFAVEG